MSHTHRIWLELACTVVVPTVVLMFGTPWLGAVGALVTALLFPIGFLVGSMIHDGRPSALAVVSLVSVVLSGGVGLLQLDPRWFAVKEAAVSTLLGLAMVGSAWTRYSVVPVVLERVFDAARTRAVLDETGGGPAFDRATRKATVQLGLVMLASAVGSFLLARAFVHSPSGSEAFTQELGRYTFWSIPIVTAPVLLASGLVMNRVIDALEAATGGRWEDLLVTGSR
jgi:hypothetical protein